MYNFTFIKFYINFKDASRFLRHFKHLVVYCMWWLHHTLYLYTCILVNLFLVTIVVFLYTKRCQRKEAMLITTLNLLSNDLLANTDSDISTPISVDTFAHGFYLSVCRRYKLVCNTLTPQIKGIHLNVNQCILLLSIINTINILVQKQLKSTRLVSCN